MPQSNLISTSLTLDTLRAIRPGFGRMLILDTHSNFAERFRTVSSLTALEDLGFASGDPAYDAFEAAIGQPGRRPSSIDIGRRTAEVAQVHTFTVTGTTDGTYTIPLDGVDFSFAASGSTNDQIRDGLISAIDASPLYAAASGGAGVIEVTAATAGLPFTVGTTVAPSPATLVGAVDTANNGVYEDLAAIRAAGSTGYGIHIADGIDDLAVALEAARWCAAVASTPSPAVVFLQADDSTLLNSVDTTSIAYRLKALARQRALTLYHADNSEHVVAGWLGKQLPTVPGSSNWAWQPLTGFTADELTADQVTALRGKYANWFELMGAQNQVFTGRMADGNYIDTIRGADKLKSDIGLGLVDLFTGAEIVPYDEAGLEQVRSDIESSISRQRFVKPGTIRVLSPSLTDADQEGRSGVELTDEDRAERRFTGFTYQATLLFGANEVQSTGTLSISDPQ